MNLLKTTAIASSLVAASFVMGTGMAKAQTVNVPFAGTVLGLCTFPNAAVPGVLAINAGTGAVTTTTPGTVALTCTGPFNFSVAAPAATGANALAGAGASTATLTVQGTTVNSGAAPTAVNAAVTLEPVSVTMTYQVDAGALPVGPGLYGFDVVVTAAGN
ncbi:hypothetical protein [Leptolyngbya sp. BL0902]|uniref:hypothetical protein n=1 Tax=Leptolyngbya sp. BL0902 TaxID=1115757 RepID=UPI0018E74A4E|nr:hypothetical protein [Leptolyngbya sp. BL0902]